MTMPGPDNPLGIDGIEFVEFATAQPQALGAALEAMGFRPTARHRSREVLLYRQGPMNLIVNAHAEATADLARPDRPAALAAIALRVRDAAVAWHHTLDLGAWEIPTRASAMELNIPGIHGVGDSLVYFVDRYADFSIYDVDFLPLPGADRHPPALAGLHYAGVVQAVGRDRTRDWIAFYGSLFGFSVRPPAGPAAGRISLASPCGRFYVELLEAPEALQGPDLSEDEALIRVALGAPEVPAATRALRERGVRFLDRDPRPLDDRRAVTQPVLGGVTFELVAAGPAAA